MRSIDSGDINAAWWDTCAEGQPVTVAALARRLKIDDWHMRAMLERLGYLQLIPRGDG